VAAREPVEGPVVLRARQPGGRAERAEILGHAPEDVTDAAVTHDRRLIVNEPLVRAGDENG
jgi:hypothetical protein